MATYDDITKIRLAPIHKVQVIFDNGDLTANSHTWEGVEKESSWNVDPVEELDINGMPRIVGWSFEAIIYLPQNDYEDALLPITDLLDKPLLGWKLHLGGQGQGNGYAEAEMGVRLDDEAFVAQVHAATLRREKVEWRPRQVLTIRGIYSRDLLTVTGADAFYTQTGGW